MAANTEGCGALVYARTTNRYLFLLRTKHRSAGHWGIPGGKIEFGETVIQGLVREIKEEIGVDFAKKKFIPLETFTADNRKFIYYTFLVDCDKEFVPELNWESAGYAWTSIDSLPNPLHPKARKMISSSRLIKKFKNFYSWVDNKNASRDNTVSQEEAS